MTVVLRRGVISRCMAEGCGCAFLMAAATASTISSGRLFLSPSLHLVTVAFCLAAALFLATAAAPKAYFNPLFALIGAAGGEVSLNEAIVYTACQILGAISSVIAVQAGFNLDPVQASSLPAQWLLPVHDFVFGTIFVIAIALMQRKMDNRFTLAALSAAAFAAMNLASLGTCFANPAISVARIVTSNSLAFSTLQAVLEAASECLSALVAIVALAWLDRRQSNARRCTFVSN